MRTDLRITPPGMSQGGCVPAERAVRKFPDSMSELTLQMTEVHGDVWLARRHVARTGQTHDPIRRDPTRPALRLAWTVTPRRERTRRVRRHVTAVRLLLSRGALSQHAAPLDQRRVAMGVRAHRIGTAAAV